MPYTLSKNVICYQNYCIFMPSQARYLNFIKLKILFDHEI